MRILRSPRAVLLAGALAGSAVFAAGCGGSAAGSSPAGEGPMASLLPPTVESSVLGVLDGEEITLESVPDQDRFQLAKLRTEYLTEAHATLERIALRAARDRVLTRAAEAKGMTLNDYLGAEVGPPEVSDAEVEQVYQRNINQMGGRPLDQIRDQLRGQIAEQKFNWSVERVADGLLGDAEWDMTVPAFRVEIETDGHAAVGPAGAPVELVVFSDFECPYCRRFNTSLDRLREEFLSEVRVVFRHHPLRNIHPRAQKAAEASLCAGDQGKFWEFHDALWTDEDLSADALDRHASGIGLDSDTFGDCLNSGRYYEQVEADVQAALGLGQGGTPAVFVNGRYVGGAISFEDLKSQIERELAEGD